MSEASQTVLEINLNSLSDNYHFLKSKLSEKTKFLGVVKAGAYGNDAISIAQKLQFLGADYLAVAYTQEGINLRKAGIHLPIMVLHPQKANFDELLKFQLEPTLYNDYSFKHFLEVASKNDCSNYPIHIKFNTGLNRLGFKSNAINNICSMLADNKSIKVESILSHLAASEDSNEKEFTLKQINDFNIIYDHMTSNISYFPIKHICNTSGILNYPEAHFDMVRSGIGIYGFGNSKEYKTKLKPITSLKSVISQKHIIKAGESIGYNRAFITNKDISSATIPVGHADGISRIYGNNKGFVYIKSQKAPIIGNVCMDMIMVDVSNINCNEGDEVILFDSQFSAAVLSENAGTISYELITSISQRINRIIIDN